MQTCCGSPRGDNQPAVTWESPAEQAAVPDLNDECACATGVSAGRQTPRTQRSTSPLRCLLMGDCSQPRGTDPAPLLPHEDDGAGTERCRMFHAQQSMPWSTPRRRWLHESHQQQWKGEGYSKAGCWSPPSEQKDFLTSLLLDKLLSQELEGERKMVHLAPCCCCDLHGDTEQFHE